MRTHSRWRLPSAFSVFSTSLSTSARSTISAADIQHVTEHHRQYLELVVSISNSGQYILHLLNALFIRGVNEYACNDCCRFCNLTTSHQTFEQRPCAFQKFTNRALHGHIYLFFSNLIFFAYRTIKMTLALKQCTKKEQRTLRTSRATPDLP